jgi:rifampicin phosphotransferase
LIIKPENIITTSSDNIGGKAANLIWLKQRGYNVPYFVVIPFSVFAENKIVALSVDDIVKCFPEHTAFAVRSSADIEDGEKYSFAGQFSTRLNVSSTDLNEAIADVASSINNDSLKTYLQQAGLSSPKLSVIVQQMIQSDFAGVAFGINPVTGEKGEYVINIVSGLGEGLVDGSKTGDAYVVKNGHIVQKACRGNEIATDTEILKVAEVVGQLNVVSELPQDVEFAFSNGELFVLQTRPVTTVSVAQKIVYDNSNIIESYPGLTLPLTFSFIEKMYSAVYIQLSYVLGIAKAKVKKHRDAYDNMLGLLNGRVYYNLNSWYTTLSLLPGYNLNSGYMEAMMGVKNKPEILVKQAKPSSFRDYADLFKAILHIIYNAATVRRQKRMFVKDFDSIYSSFAVKDYQSVSVKEIFEDYQMFERMMSSKWKAPLVNDFFAMIYFGLLQKQCVKYIPEQTGVHNALLASSDDIVTTQPLKLLPELANALSYYPDLKQALLREDADMIWELLHKPEYAGALQSVKQYIDKWGERCVAELKLETITYKQNPIFLIEVLKQYVVNDITYTQKSTDTGIDYYQTIIEKLTSKPVKRLLFKHVLSQARYLVANRENLRYYRTLGFGMVRTMMIAIGDKLAADGILLHGRDVFYLNLHEIEMVVTNDIDNKALNQIVEARKADYELYKHLPLPERVITHGKQSTILTDVNTTAGDKLSELKGIPCSAGVIRATVCKVESVDSRFPQKQIMATYATDPGYVVMFAGAAGILTERGSLLSHAAIVSREMNIPCIVGIEGLMEQLNDGDEIIMDGSTGVVKILKRHL